MKFNKVSKGIRVYMSFKELLELREQLILTPGLSRNPKTALEKLAIQLVAAADSVDPPTQL